MVGLELADFGGSSVVPGRRRPANPRRRRRGQDADRAGVLAVGHVSSPGSIGSASRITPRFPPQVVGIKSAGAGPLTIPRSGQAHVRITERAHPDVLRGPRSDAGDVQKAAFGLVPVRTGVQHDCAVGESGRQLDDRRCPAPRHREDRRIHLRDLHGGRGSAVRPRPVSRRRCRLPRRSPAGREPPGSRFPPGRMRPGCAVRECGRPAGRPQGVRDGDRVRIQVEHPAQATDGGREIAQVGQLQLHAAVIVVGCDAGSTVGVREAQIPAERGPRPRSPRRGSHAVPGNPATHRRRTGPRGKPQADPLRHPPARNATRWVSRRTPRGSCR